MRREWTIGVLPVLALMLAGCNDSPDIDIDFDEDDATFDGRTATLAPGDRFAMLTEDGVVKLGLTNEVMYIQASEVLRAHVDSAMREGIEESDSRIARSIGSAVRRGVASALEFDFDFRLEDIRDVDYRDGELVFDFVDPDDEDTLRNIDIDQEPITRAFTEQDARAFVAAFRRIKSGQSVDPTDTSTMDDTTTDSQAGADTTGGASF